MDEDYNILGKFENLSSVNIAKELLKAPEKETAKTKLADESFDSFSDLEKIVDIGKKTKKKTNTKSYRIKRNSLSKESAPIAVEPVGLPVVNKDKEVESSIARRTRSSLRSLSDVSETSLNSSTTRKKAKRMSVNNKNNSSNNQNNETAASKTSQAPKTSSKRGRKKTGSTQESSIVQNTIGSANQDTNQEDRGMALGPGHNVMRARRNYIAERAARCATVDVIDLISNPMPRGEGFISLDSDEEGKVEEVETAANSSEKLQLYFDEENPKLSVKIMWNALPEVFTLRKHQKFDHIFEQLAQREKTDKTQIFLNLESKIIYPNDTPASINYKIFQFIHGRVMVDPNFVGAQIKKKRDPNLLVLKVQSDKWKKSINVEIQKTEQFKKLIIKCSEELKLPYKQIKLSFDGEPLQLDQTPMDLEFEGGEVLDIHLKECLEN